MGKENQGAQWVHAICSVVFDIDEGQRLEECFPENALTEQEANDVAFHSFPVIMPENIICHCPQYTRPWHVCTLLECVFSALMRCTRH